MYIPAVQKGLSNLVSRTLEDLLHTEISIRRVGLGLPNRLILDEVSIKDLRHNPLLTASRLSGKIELTPLLQGRIAIANIQLYGFHLNLYQENPDEAPNFAFILDAFKGDGRKDKSPDIRINTILIRRGSLSFHKTYKPNTPERFNPDHIELDKLGATLSLKCYTRDSLDVRVKKLTCEELSGLALKQMSFRFAANRQTAELRDFHLELPCTQLQLNPFRFTYNLGNEKDATAKGIRNLTLNGSIKRCDLCVQDFAPLLPALSRLDESIPLQIRATFQGGLNHLLIPELTVGTPDNDIRIDMPCTVSLLQNADSRQITARIRTFEITEAGWKRLAALLPEDKAHIGNNLYNLGHTCIQGQITHNRKASEASLALATAGGNLQVQGTFTGEKLLNLKASTPQIDLGILTGQPERFGTAAFHISTRTRLKDTKNPDVKVDGSIDAFTFKGYCYKDISLAMNYKNGVLEGDASIKDPNATLSLNGRFGLKTKKRFINMQALMAHFNPNALKLTAKFPDRDFHADIQADLQGHGLEDLLGHISLKDLGVKTAEEDYSAGDIQLNATENEGEKSIALQSDFIQAEFDGHFRFATLITHGWEFLHHYLPTFVTAPKRAPQAEDEVSLLVDVLHTEPLKKLLGIPLQVDKPGYIGSYFNSQTQTFDFNASFPSLTYAGQHFDDILLLAGHINDSLICSADFKKDIGKTPVDFSLMLNTHNDTLATEFKWTNHGRNKYYGSIAADTRFMRDDVLHRLTTDITFRPSLIVINDSVWNMHASHITIAPQGTYVEGFTIDQGPRHLILNGNVSARETDTLTVDLHDINLEYVFNIVNFHPVDFTGRATGHAYATNLTKSPVIDARLTVKDFTFNEAYLGNMSLRGGWDKEENAILLDAHITDPPHRSTTDVNGYVRLGQPPRGRLDLTVNTENIDLSFINKYTNGIFTDLRGRATGWARIFGPFKGINLEGDALISEAQTKVTSTNVDYRIINDSISLRPDNIYFRNALLYDLQGGPGRQDHYAVVNGLLQHTSFANMRYNFNIEAHNILGYDEKDFGDEVFCGTAYATGHVSLRGKPGEVNIDINGHPEAGTVFSYNQGSPTTLTDSQFLTFKTKDSDNNGNPRSPGTNPSAPEETDTDMRINFQLDLRPNATMKILMDPKAGDYIALNGHGNIRATYYNKGQFLMYGKYTVDHGVYKLSLQDVIRKDFIFSPGGTVTFGGEPFLADLNLQAVYTVPSVSLNDLSARSTFSQNNVRVNCLMNLGGKAQAPKISFDFDLPNVNEDEKQMVRSLISTEEEKNMQVIYLLGIGRFYTYDYNADQNQSSVAMKSLLSSTLSGQLNQMFSNILGNNSNWNIGTNLSTGEVGWSDMDVEGLLSGRLLNNRLLINGNFGYRDNAATNTGNFIGDFDLQWLLTRNGNISLKAYSKTNDRYFTKSSLTTQGLGVELKHDFSSWQRLFRFMIPRKRRTKVQ